MHKKTNFEIITWTDYGSEINELIWKHTFHEELTWSENLVVMEIMLQK